MSRAEWLAERKKGIGSSDAPAICGVSSWRTPFQIFQDKRNLAPDQEDNPAMEWGRLLEPVIRQKYANVTGNVVHVPKLVWSKKYPFLFASADGLSENKRIVEIKTARDSKEWGEEGTDEVPIVYNIQVQHQMMVLELPVTDIAVLFGGSDFRIYEVPADKELQEMILEREAEFWKLVEANTPPEPISFADAVARYTRSTEKRVVATEAVLVELERLRNLKQTGKDVEEAEKEAKAVIMKHMAEADTLVDAEGNVLVTWRETKPVKRFDEKKFKENNPGIYEEYYTAGDTQRRFLLKKQKEDK